MFISTGGGFIIKIFIRTCKIFGLIIIPIILNIIIAKLIAHILCLLIMDKFLAISIAELIIIFSSLFVINYLEEKNKNERSN